MRRFVLAILLAALPGALPAQEEHAQPSVYRELAEAKTPDDVWEASLQSLVTQSRNGFIADPNLGRAEDLCPGAMDAIFEAVTPIMRRGHFLQRDEYRDGMTEIFAREFTPDQAAEALEFYRSDLGHEMLLFGSGANSYSHRVQEVLDSDDEPAPVLDRETFDADLAGTQSAIHRGIDPKIAFEANRILRRSSWYSTYARKVHPQIQDLRYSIAARDSRFSAAGGGQESARATTRALEQHFAQCEAAQELMAAKAR